MEDLNTKARSTVAVERDRRCTRARLPPRHSEFLGPYGDDGGKDFQTAQHSGSMTALIEHTALNV